ncbi:MAG: hypothetical protein AAF907_12205, partial [Planctomycetota bacterium]
MLTAAGCGGEDFGKDGDVAVFPTSGTVTVDGLPAVGAVVTFHPRGGPLAGAEKVIPSGRVDETGAFRLTTYADQDGAPEGDYAVAVSWPDPNWRPTDGGPPGDGTGGSRRERRPDLLDGAYTNPEKSGLRATVGGSETTLEP